MLKKYFSLGIIILVLAINLFLGLTRIEKYTAVDEPYWTYDRTPGFWNAIKAGKWSKTDINDKPGITVALISGLGLLKIDPMPYKHLREQPKMPYQLDAINAINFYFRLPIYLFTIIMLPLFYWLLRKLFDETTALLGFIFIGLSPILLGISLIINPDSLMWIFVPLSILSYLVYQKSDKKKYLLLSAVLAGLALLTKYVANVLYVLFFVIPFLQYIFSKEKPPIAAYLKKSAKGYLIIAAISMATYSLLYPAVWSDFNMLLKGTFLSPAFEKTWPVFVVAIAAIAADMFFLKNKITSWLLNFLSKFRAYLIYAVLGLFGALAMFVFANTYLSMRFFDLEMIVTSPKNNPDTFTIMKGFGNILGDFYGLLFGVHPVVIMGIALAIAFAFYKRKSFDSKISVSLYFIIFIILYYLASTANYVVATVRYQIVVYPFAFIVAAIGISVLLKKYVKNFTTQAMIISAIFAMSVYSLIDIKPFYFAYSSALLPDKYTLNLKDMGDGAYEAAQFLNSLPNPQNVSVWSDKGAVCALHVGECSADFNGKKLKQALPDYIVISSGRKRKTIGQWGATSSPLDFAKAYEDPNYVFSLTLGHQENNFVRIIRSTDILKK